MRKALSLALVLAVLAAGCLAAGFGWVDSAREQVTLTETVQYGDAAAAHGLTITTRAQLGSGLLWQTVHKTGAEPATATEYTYHPEGIPYAFGTVDYHVELQSFYEYGYLRSDDESGSDVKLWGLGKAYQELIDATEPGQENRTVVRMADYLEYYPLAIYLSTPEHWYGMNEAEFANDWLLPEQELTEDFYTSYPGVFYAFRQFFRIPVLEEETIELAVSRWENGRLANIGSGSTESDAFYLNTYMTAAPADGALFFTFDAHTQKDALVDTSLIPGGYGIYRLPVLTMEQLEAENRDCVFAADRLEMVYPLDPNIRLKMLSSDAAGRTLRLLAVEGDELVLTVIDAASCRTLQRIPLVEWTFEHYALDIYDGGDFLAIQLPDGRIAVVTIRDSGRYVPEFVTRRTVKEVSEAAAQYQFYFDYHSSIDFDGQKLAVLGAVNGPRGESCDLYLLVYDESGLIYMGSYASSLSTRPDPARAENHYTGIQNCGFADSRPYTVEWNERWYGPEG